MQTQSTTRPRFQLVDVARGIAIVMMFIYHFSFDLNYFNFIEQDFYRDPFWINFRIVIVSTFLAVVGISLYLAHHKHFNQRGFIKRLAILIACAALVSLSSYLMFPRSTIFFGILHFIAAASLLGVLFVRFYWLNLILGAGIILISMFYQHPVFNHPLLQWIGLMTHKPVTEDYVPLLPWFGVVLIGIFFARWAYTHGNFTALSRWQSHTVVARGLQFAGRHSLLIYMLHQPLFIGSLYLVRQVLSP